MSAFTFEDKAGPPQHPLALLRECLGILTLSFLPRTEFEFYLPTIHKKMGYKGSSEIRDIVVMGYG